MSQKHDGITFNDDFVPRLKEHEVANHRLSVEMLATEHMQRAQQRSGAKRR